MDTSQLIQSFEAFNINAFNHMAYVFETNLWLILTVVGALTIVILSIREEVDDIVDEEQNIL